MNLILRGTLFPFSLFLNFNQIQYSFCLQLHCCLTFKFFKLSFYVLRALQYRNVNVNLTILHKYESK